MKWVWVGIALFVLVDLFLVAYVLIKHKRRTTPDAATIQLVRSVWPTITSRLDQDPTGAVMDADKLLAHALERLGYKGTMAEKMKSAGPRFKAVNDLWWAHKLRNRVVHEVNVVVTPNDARRAIGAYERALSDLKLR